MIILISMFDYVVDVFYPARIHLLIVIILAATYMVRMVLNLFALFLPPLHRGLQVACHQKCDENPRMRAFFNTKSM
jgi:hypothetical protein